LTALLQARAAAVSQSLAIVDPMKAKQQAIEEQKKKLWGSQASKV
jgi:hypothetical protein